MRMVQSIVRGHSWTEEFWLQCMAQGPLLFFYVTTPSVRLKWSHKRGGLSSGTYLYSNVRPSARLWQSYNRELLNRGVTPEGANCMSISDGPASKAFEGLLIRHFLILSALPSCGGHCNWKLALDFPSNRVVVLPTRGIDPQERPG